MDSIPQDKPHYTYILYYPDDYPDSAKAGTAFYVGKGSRHRKGTDRIDDHERQARRGAKSHKCNIIRKIWFHDGQVVKKKVGYFKTHDEACMHEIALIFFMRGYEHLTNLTLGGDGVMGLKHTEETRQKLSRAGKGRPGWNKGISGMWKHSEESKSHMSEIMKGRPRSEEYRRHISESQKGKKRSEETIRRMTEVNRRIAEKKRGLPGKPHSEETRRKIGESGKGRIPPNKGIPMSAELRYKAGNGNRGRKQSDEEIAKRVASNTGRKRPPETGRKISEAKKGQSVSEETRNKLREKRKGYKPSPEDIEKAAATRRGKKHSEEWKQNQSKGRKGKGTGKVPWNKGRRIAAEKRAMAHLDVQISPEAEGRRYQQLR